MKTMKSSLLVLLLVVTNVLSANTISKKDSDPSLVAKEIHELLDKPKFQINKELLANVTFTLNGENEIVVLTVDTDNPVLENYIKERLNYNKLSSKLESQKFYKVPVRIVSTK